MNRLHRALTLLAGCVLLGPLAGCYAPFRSFGIPATNLPDTFRMPIRSGAPVLNLSALTMQSQPDYILGPRDVLEVTVHGMYQGQPAIPARLQIMASGEVNLPMAGPLRVAGMNLLQVQIAITRAYDPHYVRNARVNVTLVEKSTTSVVVLGEVAKPGVYLLPKYENDVAHAIAVAGGLGIDAGIDIEVHRRVPAEQLARSAMLEQLRVCEPGANVTLPDPRMPQPLQGGEQLPNGRPGPGGPLVMTPAVSPMRIVKIPLMGMPTEALAREDVILNPGDVVIIPSRKNEVFYVVGKLSPTNFVRFSIGARERDLGAGFVLPRDRDIDVVTAVAMAGYIDPIDSPTTVTVHRLGVDGQPLLILVDLIKARYDRRETVLVQAGDIIYLNPDAAWWSRRTFDRILPNLFSLSYRRLLGLNGQGSD